MPVTELLTLDDAKAQLNIDITTFDDDAELQVYVDAASDLVEMLVGPVRQVTVTDVLVGNSIGSVVLLRTVPIISLTSVTDTYGNAVDLSTVSFDPVAGTLHPGRYGHLLDGPYTVVYEAGRTSVPAAINLATRIIVAHLWQTQLGNSPAAGALAQEVTDTQVVPGYAIPNRATDLLAPYLLAPKVA